MLNEFAEKLHQVWQSWDYLLKRWNRWMFEWDHFSDSLESRFYDEPCWPSRLLRKYFFYRAHFKRLVNFRNMKWLDGVGVFHDDEVYKDRLLYEYIFDDDYNSSELCLSPTARFLFVQPHSKAFKTYGAVDDIKIRLCVVDLLLGEYYSVDINCLNEVSPSYYSAMFFGFYALKDDVVVFLDVYPEQRTFRQRVVSIDHHRRIAECVGHRVFCLDPFDFQFRGDFYLNCDSDYCAISNDEGKVIRFAKNPGDANCVPAKDGFMVIPDLLSVSPRQVCFSTEAPGDLFFPVYYFWGAMRMFEQGETIQNLDGRSVTFQAGSMAFYRYSFRSQGFTIQPAFRCPSTGFPSCFQGISTHSLMLCSQRCSEMVLGEAMFHHKDFPVLRTMMFSSRFLSAWVFFKACARGMFDPHYVFSAHFYFRLALSYVVCCFRKELHNYIRKLFQFHSFARGTLDTTNWCWSGIFDAYGAELHQMMISEVSREHVFFCLSYEPNRVISIRSRLSVDHNCLSLKKIVEMKLQRFPNVALKKAGRELIRCYSDS